jgi:hypothetical protein
MALPFVIKLTKGAHMSKLLTLTLTAMLLTPIAVHSAEGNEKIVFVTNDTYYSNLGGLVGADKKCQAEADASASIVPSGTYKAWLSDGTNSPDTGFTKSSHPYVLPDGTKIADDYKDLTDGDIQNIINIDSTGKTVGPNYFWSSTDFDGTSEQYFVTCEGWTWTDASPISHSMLGKTSKKSNLWTAYTRGKCGKHHRLACFQQ